MGIAAEFAERAERAAGVVDMERLAGQQPTLAASTTRDVSRGLDAVGLEL